MKLNKISLAGAVVALTVAASGAFAGTVYEKDGAKLDFSFEAGAGTFLVKNANLGAGQDFDTTTSDDRQDVGWQEFYMLPKVSGSLAAGPSSLYGEVGMLASGTWGNGDAAGYTTGGDHHLDNELAYIGWKSGTLFATENLIDAYYGKARFSVSDGFVLGDGTADGNSAVGGNHPAFWMGPHSSFKRAAVLKVNTAPVRGDLFRIETDYTQAKTEGYGVNVEGTLGGYGTLGAMYLRLTESDNDARNGMRVYELRYMGNPLNAFLADFYLNLEYAHENNPDAATAVDAYAWAAEVGYTIPGCPVHSALAYRFAVYSGDENGADNEDNAYDPLFQKAFGRGWGTWLEGEIMGEYMNINSNKRSHTLIYKAKPTESVAMGLIGYRFDVDANNYWGTPVTSSHMADEANLYVDWTVSEKLIISAAAGRAWPGSALKNIGYDEKTDVVELIAYIYF